MGSAMYFYGSISFANDKTVPAECPPYDSFPVSHYTIRNFICKALVDFLLKFLEIPLNVSTVHR